MIKRAISTRQRPLKSEKIRTTAHYTIATTIAFLAFSYASVPLYRIYCQTTGKGGRAFIAQTEEKIAKMNMNEDRKINVSFVADTNSAMAWNFKPTQNVMEVFFCHFEFKIRFTLFCFLFSFRFYLEKQPWPFLLQKIL